MEKETSGVNSEEKPRKSEELFSTVYSDDPDELWAFFKKEYPTFKKEKEKMLEKEKQARMEKCRAILQRLWPFQNKQKNR